MTQIRFSKILTAFCMGLFFLHPRFSIGQDVPIAPAEKKVAESSSVESGPVEPLQIKLSVNEVRLDVVVLDRRGNPVTDLTDKDFEVYQNGARQNIISSVYIDNRPNSAAKPSPAKKDARKDNWNLPTPPATDLKREDTRRTIIFVVDDISMSFENHYYARMALRNFVEKQMQAGDMAAILRTGHGNSALQLFLSDKREALARIDAMRMEKALMPNPDCSHLYRVYDNQLSAISYSLRALKDMPGRKMLVVMTAISTLRRLNFDFGSMFIMTGDSVSPPPVDLNAEYNDRFSRLADDALRTGVVVNFLNINGLQNIPRFQDILEKLYGSKFGQYTTTTETQTYTVGDTTLTIEVPVPIPIPAEGFVADATQNVLKAIDLAKSVTNDRQGRLAVLMQLIPETIESAMNSDPRNAVNPLPAKTGGVIIENSNFFLDGIGRETESLMKGYYLVSYVPPSGTFSSGDKETVKEIFNRIKVNVRRRGLTVYTRDGFYNRLESEIDTAAPAAHPLQDAVFSPFTHSELNVNVVAGYVKDAKAGHLVRSWIHVDPKDVKIVDTQNGGARIDLEMVCLTSDTNGFIQDSRFVEHTLTIEPENKVENLALIQKHGIRFAILLPVKKPGFYYVRVAVRDRESDKTGSAYQFVEIPDLGKKGLALSNIFMIPSADDLNWLLSPATTEEGVFFPVFQAEEVRSPALRTYASGDDMQILAMLYNADEKAMAGSEIEMRFVLYKDGKEFQSVGGSVGPGSVGNLDGVPLFLRWTMGTDIPPGDYVLELRVSDKRNSQRREGNASQAISFTVTEK